MPLSKEVVGRVYRNTLARSRRLRQCGLGDCVSWPRDRFRGCLTRIRLDGSDRSIRSRSHFGRTFQPGCYARPLGGQTISGERHPAVYNRAGARGDRRCGDLVSSSQAARAGFRSSGGFAANGFGDTPGSPGSYDAARGICGRGRDDVLFPDRHPWMRHTDEHQRVLHRSRSVFA